MPICPKRAALLSPGRNWQDCHPLSSCSQYCLGLPILRRQCLGGPGMHDWRAREWSWLGSARLRCPKKVRRRLRIVSDKNGCPVRDRTSSFETKSVQWIWIICLRHQLSLLSLPVGLQLLSTNAIKNGYWAEILFCTVLSKLRDLKWFVVIKTLRNCIKIGPKIQRMSLNNFGAGGTIFTKLLQTTCRNAGVITRIQLLEDPPPKKICEGQKNVQISARFLTTFDFDREYLWNGSRYPKSENVTNYGNSSCV